MSISLTAKTKYILFADDVSLNRSQPILLSNDGDINDVLVLAMMTDKKTNWKNSQNYTNKKKVKSFLDDVMKLCGFESNAQNRPTQKTVESLRYSNLWWHYNYYPEDELLKLLGELDPALKSKTN